MVYRSPQPFHSYTWRRFTLPLLKRPAQLGTSMVTPGHPHDSPLALLRRKVWLQRREKIRDIRAQRDKEPSREAARGKEASGKVRQECIVYVYTLFQGVSVSFLFDPAWRTKARLDCCRPAATLTVVDYKLSISTSGWRHVRPPQCATRNQRGWVQPDKNAVAGLIAQKAILST